MEDTFRKLRLNSPPGGWFPAIQDLFWRITESSIPYADLFFSPHLKNICIFMSLSWIHSGIPRDILPSVASTISALPSSTLQYLCVDNTMPRADLKDPLSSVVLRFGPSLTRFIPSVPLSDAAINHLIRLPHLRGWRVEGPPPSYSALSLPLVFPPLADLTLGGDNPHGWLSLFEHPEDSTSATPGVTPLSVMKESLECLDIENTPNHTIDVSFISPIHMFHNLATLFIQADCYETDDEDQCTFKLNDDDVAKLTMALPQLEVLILGAPCPENACATTVACLLQISVHCVKLQELTIHFNTTNIVDDLKNVLGDPRFAELRSSPRCALSYLGVWQTPLTVDGLDIEVVVNGMVDIFPSLGPCEEETHNLDWKEFFERIGELRRI